jgi:hypothetical protein
MNRIATFIIGLALALPALFFVILGVTFLPVIGILIALPVMCVSVTFMRYGLREAAMVAVPEVSEAFEAKRAMGEMILQPEISTAPGKISKKVHSGVCVSQFIGALSHVPNVPERNSLEVEYSDNKCGSLNFAHS